LPSWARSWPPDPPADDDVEDDDEDDDEVDELEDCRADPPQAAATRATRSRPTPVRARRPALSGL
jgi:hypothetical protein